MQLVSKPFLTAETLSEAVIIQSSKLRSEKSKTKFDDVSTARAEKLGYADFVQYYNDTIMWCPYLFDFPSLFVNSNEDDTCDNVVVSEPIEDESS